MAARYDIVVRNDGKKLSRLIRSCRMSHAMEVAQRAVLERRDGTSAEILRKRGKPPWLVMRYWWDSGLQYVRY